jgi:hypothetical protein
MDEQHEPYATRRELDQVREEMRAMRTDATTIAVLGTQLTTLTANLLEFKVDVNQRFDAHDKLHATAERERSASRRWLIGTCLAALTILAGLYGWVALLVHH